MTERQQTAYKILTAAELAALEADATFAGSADDLRDGFIHLSTAEQLDGTLAKHYAGATDLQIAAVDLAAYSDTAIRWETARDGQDFPHLYEPLLLETIIAYRAVERDEGGAIRLPIAG